jgi:hypothetical protein
LHWEAGTPVTRYLVVEAEGLRADQIPDLTIEKIPGVTIYSDTPKRQNRIQDNSMIGVLEQKVTYLPTTASTLIIPAASLHWWNVEKNISAISETKPLSVQIMSAAARNKPTGSGKAVPSTAYRSTGLKVINHTNAHPFYYSVWFWLSMILSAGWLFTLWMIWHKKNNVEAMETPLSTDIPAELPTELTHTDFKLACREGDALTAQRFLLSWAKNQWPDLSLNLEKIGELVQFEDFKQAIIELEHAIYSRQAIHWNGQKLYITYQQYQQQHGLIRRLFTKKKPANQATEPLPPLNP